MLCCGSSATPGAVTFDDLDFQQSVRTAANYFVDVATNVLSCFKFAEFETRLVADCRRRHDIYTPEPWSDEDVLAKFYDEINSVHMPPLNVQEHGQEYKKICHYPSVSPHARIEEMKYLRCY